MTNKKMFKKLRVNADWTQGEVSQKMGWSGGRNVTYMKESGKRPVTGSDLMLLAMMTGQTIKKTKAGEWVFPRAES